MNNDKLRYLYDEENNKVGVFLSIKDFEHLLDDLQDVHDYELLKKRTAKITKTYTLDEVMTDILGKQ